MGRGESKALLLGRRERQVLLSENALAMCERINAGEDLSLEEVRQAAHNAPPRAAEELAVAWVESYLIKASPGKDHSEDRALARVLTRWVIKEDDLDIREADLKKVLYQGVAGRRVQDLLDGWIDNLDGDLVTRYTTHAPASAKAQEAVEGMLPLFRLEVPQRSVIDIARQDFVLAMLDAFSATKTKWTWGDLRRTDTLIKRLSEEFDQEEKTPLIQEEFLSAMVNAFRHGIPSSQGVDEVQFALLHLARELMPSVVASPMQGVSDREVRERMKALIED